MQLLYYNGHGPCICVRPVRYIHLFLMIDTVMMCCPNWYTLLMIFWCWYSLTIFICVVVTVGSVVGQYSRTFISLQCPFHSFDILPMKVPCLSVHVVLYITTWPYSDICPVMIPHLLLLLLIYTPASTVVYSDDPHIPFLRIFYRLLLFLHLPCLPVVTTLHFCLIHYVVITDTLLVLTFTRYWPVTLLLFVDDLSIFCIPHLCCLRYSLLWPVDIFNSTTASLLICVTDFLYFCWNSGGYLPFRHSTCLFIVAFILILITLTITPVLWWCDTRTRYWTCSLRTCTIRFRAFYVRYIAVCDGYHAIHYHSCSVVLRYSTAFVVVVPLPFIHVRYVCSVHSCSCYADACYSLVSMIRVAFNFRFLQRVTCSTFYTLGPLLSKFCPAFPVRATTIFHCCSYTVFIHYLLMAPVLTFDTCLFIIYLMLFIPNALVMIFILFFHLFIYCYWWYWNEWLFCYLLCCVLRCNLMIF